MMAKIRNSNNHGLINLMMSEKKSDDAKQQDPFVQNVVSLTLSLSPQFVNFVSTLKANGI